MFIFVLAFVALPLLFLYKIGLESVVKWILISMFMLLVMAVASALGLLLDFMFFGENYRGYVAPKLFTDSFANNLDNLGQALLIPFIAVFDIIILVVHFTFTEAGWLTWICQLFGIYIIMNFFGAGITKD